MTALTIWLSNQSERPLPSRSSRPVSVLALLVHATVMVHRQRRRRTAREPVFSGSERLDQAAFGSIAAFVVIGYLLGRRAERHAAGIMKHPRQATEQAALSPSVRFPGIGAGQLRRQLPDLFLGALYYARGFCALVLATLLTLTLAHWFADGALRHTDSGLGILSVGASVPR